MDTATKTGTDAVKTLLKKKIQKPEEATRDLTGNKSLINVIQKVKQKVKKKRMREIEDKEIKYQQKKDSILLMI